jgi:hypothetical protein
MPVCSEESILTALVARTRHQLQLCVSDAKRIKGRLLLPWSTALIKLYQVLVNMPDLEVYVVHVVN